MKRLIKILLFLIAILFLSACGESQSQQKQVKESDSTIQSKEIQIDMETENRYAYIKDHFKNENEIFIKVDYVDYLTGQKATEAEWRDKAYFVDGKDTISKITDGYYISNINPKIRTFRIGKNAQIENVITDDGSHKMEEKKLLNAEQLSFYIKEEVLVFLHIKAGVIESIDERFMP